METVWVLLATLGIGTIDVLGWRWLRPRLHQLRELDVVSKVTGAVLCSLFALLGIFDPFVVAIEELGLAGIPLAVATSVLSIEVAFLMPLRAVWGQRFWLNAGRRQRAKMKAGGRELPDGLFKRLVDRYLDEEKPKAD